MACAVYRQCLVHKYTLGMSKHGRTFYELFPENLKNNYGKLAFSPVNPTMIVIAIEAFSVENNSGKYSTEASAF